MYWNIYEFEDEEEDIEVYLPSSVLASPGKY